MKRNNLKQPLLFVPFLLVLFVYDSAGGQLPPGVVASFYYSEQGHVIRQEKDTNGDRKIDLWIYYDKDGRVERVEKDVNFDGKPDTWIFYEGGKNDRRSLATKTVELMHGFISMTKEKSSVKGSIPRAMGNLTFGNSIRTINSSGTKRIPRGMAVWTASPIFKMARSAVLKRTPK